MDFFKSLFEDKLTVDTREPWLSGIEIPGVEGSFDVLAPRPDPWMQLATLFAAQTGVQCLFAVIIYLAIIKNRGKQFTYFLGYGVIIPLCCYLPFPVIDYLDLRNRVVRLTLTVVPCMVSFRCIEAMHGTSPPVAESSLGSYVAYYSSLFDFYWVKETLSRQRITGKQLGDRFYRITCHYLLLSLIVSYLMHYDFKPFPSPVQLDQYNLNMDLFMPGQLLNNYLYGVMTFFCLNLGWNMAALSINLQGFQTVLPFHNPLFTSRSPSDFWGRKWNMTIHEMLKRGAYKPARVLGYPAYAATLAAFIASGFLHDFTWAVQFVPTANQRDENGNCIEDCWYPLAGKQTAFFLWCGFTMLLEKPVGKLAPVQWMAKNLPVPIISTLVVMTALPFAHWYPGDWIVGRYFHHYSMGLFQIQYNQA